MEKEQLLQEYQQVFSEVGKSVYFSPGRINLIGEYTDFNGGHVFPCAISLGTYGVFSPRSDNKVRLSSANMADSPVVEFDINESEPETAKENTWANYFKGMIVQLRQNGYSFDHGFNLLVHGNLPYGAGLSSSASIELLMGDILKEEYGLDVEQLTLVKLGQKVENDYIGLNSGIMDQFAVGMGKKDNAILLDANTLEYHYYPLELGDYIVVIMNTNKKHALADSKYNERRAQNEEAVRRLQAKLDIKYLGELTTDQIDQYSYLINDDILIRRARHVVIENQRTLQARDALLKGDLELLGRLINASHVSLEYDYEVSGVELDTLAETAWKQPGVLGARMIGGGFGGSGIAIVKKDQVENFKKNVGQAYVDKIGYEADFYDTEIADGPKKL
ncbi:galactokinase [Paucilactobacillus suebicus]|uniref:Galactokinase n=1 Tax=Paucilactobacillus suebicus DSM 5007 = KCTC 3549 TaxID=1423807 RepID=A0A0R1W842_9LACO|nr:galactokinase [Paucilactobacillus suebicus]KRM11769.1 galactokinase [Paucilactobacillus suebicus DSM 5007 = KCTC 3549]